MGVVDAPPHPIVSAESEIDAAELEFGAAESEFVDAPIRATNANGSAQAEDNRSRPESIEIEIDETGDAHVVLSKEFPTETEAERRAFERLADEYERGQHGNLGFSSFQSAFEDVAAASARDMELVDDGRHTVQENGVGRLEYRFTWTNFAQVEDGSVTIGDAFSVDGDVWLQLYEGQQLVIQAPDGYGVAASPSGPEIEDEALIWTGPATFSPGDLDVTFGESAGESSSFPTTLLLGLGLAFLFVGVLVLVWWMLGRRSGDRGILEQSVRERIDGILPEGTTTAGGSATDAETAANDPPGSAATTSEETGAAADAEPSAAPDPAGTGGEPVNPELLSDEERVEYLLEENGGRMKQANIVSETGWSNAKVSQLLSRMAEEENVDKLRIGRENLITLPDVDVTEGNGDDP
jgi:hypothetical protein